MVNQTDEKFLAVTGYSLAEYQQFTSSEKYNHYKSRYKIESFRKIFTDTPLYEFSEHLYYYLIFAIRHLDDYKTKHDRYCEISKDDLLYKEELVITLKNLLSGWKLKATIKKGKLSQVINKSKLLDQLKEAAVSTLRNTINELGLNEYPLSKEMAIEEINNQADIQWIETWMESMGYIDPDFASFTLDRFDDYFNKLGLLPAIPWMKDSIRENMIMEYACDHRKKNDLDIIELDNILAKIKVVSSKAGPKESTYFKKHIAYVLSILLRLERFLEDKSITRIDEVGIENTDLRLIYEVMRFYRLIVDYRDGPKNKNNLEPRVRKMITDFKDLTTIEDHNEKLLALRFNYYSNQSIDKTAFRITSD